MDMSPFDSVSRVSVWGVAHVGRLGFGYVDDESGVRPVINLNSTVEITSGDGTSSNPYVIKAN